MLKYFMEIKNEYFDYDKVVLATHADEALSLIENPTDNEKKILSNFQYKKNLAVIHTDKSNAKKIKKHGVLGMLN